MTTRSGEKIYSDNPDLYYGAKEEPIEYGFRDVQEVDATYRNPDTRYSNARKLPNLLRYVTPCARPDGTFVGTPKATNTRDVYAITDIYYYENYRLYNNERVTRNPVGFYLVL